MTDTPAPKSIGSAIDDIVAALTALPEASRLTAVRAACEHVGLLLPAPAAPRTATPVGNSSHKETVEIAQAGAGPIDIRSLKEAKNPANNTEMACVMAYYVQTLAPTSERKTVFTGADVEKYFAQAGFPLPRVPGQVLIDAKAAGYFDGVDRGTYRLNPVGYNLVVHNLPRKSASAAKSPRRSGARKATTKRGSARAQ